MIISSRSSSSSIIFASIALVASKNSSSEAVQVVSKNRSQRKNSSSSSVSKNSAEKTKTKTSNQSSKKNNSSSFAIANDAIKKSESESQFDKKIFFNTSKIDSFYLSFDVNFQLIDDLLYHVKKNQLRLCISKNSIHDVLRLAHDDNSHADYHKAYVKLKFVYIRKLSR